MIKKRMAKNITALAITFILTIAMAVTALAAPGGFGGKGGPGGSTGGKGAMQNKQQEASADGDGSNIERPELPDGEAPSGERPELPDGEAPSGERPELPNGEAPSGERPELPDGEAPSGEKPELPDGKAPSGERPELPKGKAPAGDMKGINTDDISTAIEALEDGDVKTDLESLLSDYETAKAALDTAINDGSDDIDSCREAEMKAMEALRAALEEAGIDTRPELPDGEMNNESEMDQCSEKPVDNGDSDAPPEKPSSVQKESTDSGSDQRSGNLFARFGNWFKSLFFK